MGLAALSCAAVVAVAGCSGGSPQPAPTTASPTATASPSPSEKPINRPSGLIWDSGVVGHRPDRSAAFATMRGHALDVLGVSPTRSSWSELMGDWWLQPQTIPRGFKGTLNVAMPMFPEDGNMATAARGGYNKEWAAFAKKLAKRYPTAYVRPGWEMNIPNWGWSANPGNVEQFKAAFRQASITMKKAAPGLRIVWNVNEGKGDSLPDARMAWPGDDVVDIVAIDAYDWSPPYDEKGWEKHKSQEGGWDFWGTFARQHGKKFAVPEWGVITGNDGSGGDNPTFVNSVYAWMEGNRDIMAFETYFDETDDYCKCALSLNPKAEAAYKAWMPKLTQPKSTASSSSVGSTGAAAIPPAREQSAASS